MTEIVKDPDLLAALKPVWRAFGCAVCGQAVAEPEFGTSIPSGWDIELHHLDKRGRPDEAHKLLGLCGELLPNKCHWAAEQGHIRFAEDLPPSSWVDTRVGGSVWQPVRYPYLEVAALGVSPPVGPERSTEVRLLPPAPQSSATIGQGAGATTAEQRLQAIRSLVIIAEQNRLLIAVNLHAAWQNGEPAQLGLDWAQYLEAVGVSRSAATKMLTAVSILTPDRIVAASDDPRMSLERAYQAARGARTGVWAPAEAIEYAAVHPVHEIVAKLKGEPDEREMHTCSCGHVHVRQRDEAQ